MAGASDSGPDSTDNGFSNNGSLSDYVSAFGDIAKQGASVYSAVSGKNGQAPVSTHAPTATSSPLPISSGSISQYLLWGGIGLAVIVVLALVFRRS